MRMRRLIFAFIVFIGIRQVLSCSGSLVYAQPHHEKPASLPKVRAHAERFISTMFFAVLLVKYSSLKCEFRLCKLK